MNDKSCFRCKSMHLSETYILIIKYKKKKQKKTLHVSYTNNGKKHVYSYFLESTSRLYFGYRWNITKTCPYYFDPPPKPHFYIVKLGFTGV